MKRPYKTLRPVLRLLVMIFGAELIGAMSANFSNGDWSRMAVLSMNAQASEAPEQKQEPIKLTFDTLRNWTYIEGKTPIPDSIQALNGQRITMTGFMMPMTDVTKIKVFVLVPYLFGCCYGQPPAPNHVILATMHEGQTTEFIPDVIQVTGIFHVGETREDGYLVSLYRLDCEAIKRPAPRLPHVGDLSSPN